MLSTPYPASIAPITVAIGGRQTEVIYYGGASNNPGGIFRIDARVPSDIQPGEALVFPIVGGVPSTQRVTVYVK